MLSKTTLGVSFSLAETLADRHVKLEAVNDSPLDSLVRYSTQAVDAQGSVALGVQLQSRPLSELLEIGAAQEIGGNFPHDDLIHHITTQAAGLLGATHDVAQNKVIPAIRRVVEAVSTAIDESVKAGTSPLEIIQQRFEPLYDFVYLRDLTARYQSAISSVALHQFDIVPGDYLEALSIGHTTIDEAVKEAAQRYGQERLAALWDRLFGRSATGTTQEVFQSDPTAAALGFFFAARLTTCTPEGLSTDSSAWSAHVNRVMAAAGAWICRHYAMRAQTVAAGAMVLECPGGQQPVGTIVVDADVYAKFIAEGGSPEVLFGAAYSTRQFEPAKLLADAVKHRAYWDSVVAMYRNATASMRTDAMITSLRAAVTAEINNLSEDDLLIDRPAMHSLLQEHLTHVKARQIEDLWDLARKAICRTMYRSTEVEAFLLAMDEQSKLTPDLPAREIATLASIDFIAKWLSELIVISSPYEK